MRLFLHFCDPVFLRQKGITGFNPYVIAEMDTAIRLSLLLTDETFIPLSSYIESPLGRLVLNKFQDLIRLGFIQLVGPGISYEEVRELKLIQYSSEQSPGQYYRRIKRLPFPLKLRLRDTTDDIVSRWKDVLRVGEVPNLLGETSEFFKGDVEKLWEGVPDQLENRGFIIENVLPLLCRKPIDVPIRMKNIIISVINEAYLRSYTLELGASVFREMIYLDSPIELHSGDPNNDINFRKLFKELYRNGMLATIKKVNPMQLLQYRKDERWLIAVAKILPNRLIEMSEETGFFYRSSVRSAEEINMMQLNQARVLIVTALPKETAAVSSVMDIIKDKIGMPNDPNIYKLATIPGQIGDVYRTAIILTTSRKGKLNAATATTHALRTFLNVEYVIMVGIAGGCPNPTKPDEHVRLGDIVISDSGGIIEYDDIKRTESEIQIRSQAQKPSYAFLQCLNSLLEKNYRGQRPWERYIERAVNGVEGARRPESSSDVLLDGSQIIPHPADGQRREGFPRIFSGRNGTSDT